MLGGLLGSWFAAASTGAIAAWGLNFFRDRWARPRLDITIDYDRGSVVETLTIDGAAHHKYARLVVRNRGGSLAKNCRASIDYIRRTDPAASHFHFRSDLVDLKWSLLTEARTAFDIPLRGYRLLDVGHTYISNADVVAKNLSNSKFWIDGAILPERLLAELRMNANYEIHIQAHADNAAPVEFSCRIRLEAPFTTSPLSLAPIRGRAMKGGSFRKPARQNELGDVARRRR